MWKEGMFEIDGVGFEYEAKVYGLPSPVGVNSGRISKLRIRYSGREATWEDVFVNYDCGWDIRPRTALEKKALQYVLDLYK